MLAALLAGCASSRFMQNDEGSMPIVILQHADGSEDWGRILSVTGDSLAIRRIEDMQPFSVAAGDIINVYRIERQHPNYALAFGAGALAMAGSWGVVVGLNHGDTSSGSFLIAGAVGIIPATLVGTKVAEWTRHYKIIPMNVIGSDGRLDVNMLRSDLNSLRMQ